MMSLLSFLILLICVPLLFFLNQSSYGFISFIDLFKKSAIGINFFLQLVFYFIDFHFHLYCFLTSTQFTLVVLQILNLDGQITAFKPCFFLIQAFKTISSNHYFNLTNSEVVFSFYFSSKHFQISPVIFYLTSGLSRSNSKYLRLSRYLFVINF